MLHFLVTWSVTIAWLAKQLVRFSAVLLSNHPIVLSYDTQIADQELLCDYCDNARGYHTRTAAAASVAEPFLVEDFVFRCRSTSFTFHLHIALIINSVNICMVFPP